MKPEYNAQKVLSYTQSIAKMIEFDVPEQDRNIDITRKPEELFTLVIGMLGDISEQIISTVGSNGNVYEQENDIRFCASFFDSYKNTQRLQYLDDYALLIGAAAYYLCNLPGSTSVLIDKLNISHMNLLASKLEFILYWLLKGDYSNSLSKLDSCYAEPALSVSTSFYNYFQSGNGEEEVYNACQTFQTFAYERHNPRELFFSDLIYAICIKKIRNSCWKTLPEFSGLSKDLWKQVINKKEFIRELWPSQILLGKENVFKGQSAVIQMPTSAGKTKSTEIIIRSSFLSEKTKVAVVVAPFRALCHEIESEFYKAFWGEKNISIDEINDVLEDSELNLFVDSSKKHIIILTPEKLYYLLTLQHNFAENIGLIIFDEGHQFDSGERGVTYELLLTELKRFLPDACQRILISAVIHNAEQISNWLSPNNIVVQGNKTLPTERSIGIVDFSYGTGQINFINQFDYNHDDYFVPKVIPIIELPKKPRERKIKYFPDRTDANSVALFLALKMSTKENVAIFCGTKNSVSKILDLSNDYFNRVINGYKPKKDNDECQKISRLIEKNLGIENSVYAASLNGVFAHHADIPHGIKMSIEYAMHKSMISFIVCTSTLAQGVNLPIKYMFISSTQQGGDRIKVRDFQNLIGRVGRAGKLTEGCIIFTNQELSYRDSFYWNDMIELLDSNNSEDCTSSLLYIFEPLRQGENTLSFKAVKFIIDLYYNINENPESLAEKINSNYPSFDIDALKKQIAIKFQYIEKIENFLMILGEKISTQMALEIAKSTLAYHVANAQQKIEIENLFTLITEKINENETDKKQLPVYAKTMRGLNQTYNLRNTIIERKDLIVSSSSTHDLLELLWDLFENGNIQNSAFSFYSNKLKLKEATLKWLNGEPFIELFKLLEGEKINRRDYIRIESCVNIFENGIAYSGSVLINAIAEILNAFEEQGNDSTIELLKLFQKKLKYGLPTIESILIYEWGFCDRVLAQEIAAIVPSANEKYLMKISILQKKDEIIQLLNKYPSYYLSVFEQISS